jgi:hypothetical protein
LILFGTKETNSLIAKFSDQLPIQLNSGATGYGLVYIFPVGAHYVLINSGLPWWSVAEPGQSPASTAPSPRRTFPRLVSGPITALMGIGDYDYVLFKGSTENLVTAGHFDGNWRMPDSDIEKMQASDAVTATAVTMKSQN